jgi:MFS family permease
MSAPPGPPYAALAVAFAGAVLATTSGPAAGQLLGDMAGGLSVSRDRAQWLSTLYLVGQAAAVPLAFPLMQALGPARAMALAGTGLAFTAAGVVLAPSFETAGAARLAQGAFATIPPVLMMALVMRSFPPGRGQIEGLAIFALSTTIGLGLAPSLAALGLGGFGWRGFFALVALLAALYAVAASVSAPSPPANATPFARLDWPGTVLLGVGLGGIIVALDQGERLFWLQSALVATALAVGATALGVAIWWMRAAATPLFDGALVRRPSFAMAIGMAALFRVALLVAAFVAPQYLARVQGFRVEQLAGVLAPMVPATIAGVLIGWALVKADRPRAALCLGILLFAAAAGVASDLSPVWAAQEFRLIAAMSGLAQGVFTVGVLRYATAGVRPEQGPTAGGLFNLTRVVGQVGGSAAIGHLVTVSEARHSAVLVETLTPGDPETAGRLAALAGSALLVTADANAAAAEAATRLIATQRGQAFTLAYADAFAALAWVLIAAAALVWALPSLPRANPGVPAR